MGLKAIRADTVTEIGIGVLRNVIFDPLPVSGIIADAFAVAADREQTMQGADGGEAFGQLCGRLAQVQLGNDLAAEGFEVSQRSVKPWV